MRFSKEKSRYEYIDLTVEVYKEYRNGIIVVEEKHSNFQSVRLTFFLFL